MEEAVKQLAPLIPTRPNWPYALVLHNTDTHHVPLPNEGHLSILMEGGTSSATCGWISQLDIWQLLSSGSQIIYPVGLNGCEIPVIMSLSKSLAKGTAMLGGEPIYLSVDMLQSTAKGQESKAHPLAVTQFPSWPQALSGLLCLRQKGKSEWPWKWGISYPRWYQTPLDKCQGVPPQRG